jgi:excisionase family DNA binding protein
MNSDAEPSNDLWDASDVARYLKASRSWVYHQAEAGRLPHLRIGGLLRFDPPTVKAFARGEAAREAKVLTMRPRASVERG